MQRDGQQQIGQGGARFHYPLFQQGHQSGRCDKTTAILELTNQATDRLFVGASRQRRVQDWRLALAGTTEGLLGRNPQGALATAGPQAWHQFQADGAEIGNRVMAAEVAQQAKRWGTTDHDTSLCDGRTRW